MSLSKAVLMLSLFYLGACASKQEKVSVEEPEKLDRSFASGTGEIDCGGRITAVGPGAVMYCAGQVVHGITNTGKVPLTFYWSKWLGKNS